MLCLNSQSYIYFRRTLIKDTYTYLPLTRKYTNKVQYNHQERLNCIVEPPGVQVVTASLRLVIAKFNFELKTKLFSFCILI